MDKVAAQLLVRSFLGRLERRQNFYEGRLSVDDVSALEALCDLEQHALAKPLDYPQAVERPKAAGIVPYELKIDAFKRSGPPVEELRICLDFGTAMSKAWATGHDAAQTLPLVIGRPAGLGDVLMVPSSIFIGDNGRIYLGQEAERQHRIDLRPDRFRFDNLKRMLSEEQIGSDLYSLPLRPGLDPTNSGLSPGDLLVLYLAWLTDLSERALTDAVSATGGALSFGEFDHRGVTRRYAIPCFEVADDETDHRVNRAEWARNTMQDALLRAQVLADSLSENWSQLTTARLAPLMKHLRDLDVTPLSSLMAIDPAIREPIAAGASRFDAVLGRDEPASQPTRRLLMVVDAGAGTTDFCMFQAITPIGHEAPRYGLLRGSVRMSRIAGNEIDAILRPLILESCGINPHNGNPRSEEDFAYIRTDLDSQIRNLKRILFDRQKVDIELKPNASGTLELATLVSDPKFEQRGRELLKIRNEIVADVITAEKLEVVRSINASMGQPYPIHILLTGGSSGLPIIRELASGELDLHGARFRFFPVERVPTWIDDLPRETAQLLTSVYPQCAVAIGGSAAKLPEELRDMELITPPRRGERKLERFQTQGL